MSSALDLAQNPAAPAAPRARSRLSVTQKRWLLSLHLVCLGAWLGGVLCSLVLNLTALSTTDPQVLNAVYSLSGLLDNSIIKFGAVAGLTTGLLLAFLTQWGLLRFFWVVAKELLTLAGIVLDLRIIHWNEAVIKLIAAQGLQAISNPLYLNNRALLFAGIVARLVLLPTIIVISIFKPWGQIRRRPARA